MNPIDEVNEIPEETAETLNEKSEEKIEESGDEEEKDSRFPDTQIKIDLSGAKYGEIYKNTLQAKSLNTLLFSPVFKMPKFSQC